MSPRDWLALLGTAVFVLAVAPVAAQDDEEVIDRTPEKCVGTNRIDRTKVIDDRTVIFYLRGGNIYQNILPRNCPGLERNNRFMYTPFGGRLCDTDTITVLEQFAGRFDRGFTCPLGTFHQISEIEAADLVGGPGAIDSSVEVEAVELPDDDAADAEDSDAGRDDEASDETGDD
jgi:hypothetical protein